jgi:hypothetical protein
MFSLGLCDQTGRCSTRGQQRQSRRDWASIRAIAIVSVAMESRNGAVDPCLQSGFASPENPAFSAWPGYSLRHGWGLRRIGGR